MKVVHLADSHLGFSSYSNLDQHGRNRIEEMVYSGFEQAVDKIIQLRPDAVVHAGDVFHHVRPKIRPLVVFKRGLQRLTEEGIPVVVISGNHDTPKSFSSTSPFLIYEGTRDVHIAHRYQYERFELDDHIFHCIPFCLEPQDYLTEFEKLKRFGQDVLIMHGLVESLRSKRLRTVGEHELKDSLLKRDFDYIALGHFHGQTPVGSNAWYSGSIEYFNFGEANDKKGLLVVDLDRDEVASVEVKEKNMVDYPALDCSGLSSEEIAEEIMGLTKDEEMADKMVRITLKNVNRAAYRSIDPGRLYKLGAPALHFKIKAEFVDEQERIERPVDRFSLHQEFVRFLEEEAAHESIPVAMMEEVTGYGADLIKKAVQAKNTEALNASQ